VRLGGSSWSALDRDVERCSRCPRLRTHCREVARIKRRAFLTEAYWGLPVPGFGDPAARILVLGLAPAAHGANRTGRMFTGDRSGEWLWRALHEAGLADRPASTHRDDGLELRGAYVTAACRCAPPANRPAPRELANCAEFLDREFDLLVDLRVVLALGRVAWDAALARAARIAGNRRDAGPRPRFAHLAQSRVAIRPGTSAWLVGSYHPSQQNTFTGRLTRPMFAAAIERAVSLSRDVGGDPLVGHAGTSLPQ